MQIHILYITRVLIMATQIIRLKPMSIHIVSKKYSSNMKKLLLLLFLLPISLFGQQIWVTVDPKGQDYQSAVLSKVILDSFEEDSISSWLNKKINFSILLEMDTLGYVHQVLKVNCRKANYLKNCKERLEKALIEKHIRIPLWYEPIPVADPVNVIIQSIREDAQSSTDSS